MELRKKVIWKLRPLPLMSFIILISFGNDSMIELCQSSVLAETTTPPTMQMATKKPTEIIQTNQIELNLNDPTGYFTDNSLHSIYDSRLTFDQYIAYSMKSISLVAGYDNDLHRYDHKQDLIDSFARNLTYSDDLSKLRAYIDPSETDLLSDQNELTLIENELNQDKCEQQLDLLFSETLKLFQSSQAYSNSRQLGLIDFLDSYGSTPSFQSMMGNSLSLGSMNQCIRAKISVKPSINQQQHQQDAPLLSGRYCVAKFRSPNWLVDNSGEPTIKLGVCLPSACNSLSIRRHSYRLETLIKLVRLQQVPMSSYKLTQLFCLPDEASPLRQLSVSAKFFVATLLIWLTLVVYSSLKYELSCSKDRNNNNIFDFDNDNSNSKLIKIFALRLAWSKLFESQASKRCDKQQTEAIVGVDKAQSLASHLPVLEHFSPALELGVPKLAKITQKHANGGIELNKNQCNQATEPISVCESSLSLEQETNTSEHQVVDLSAIDGIKVLSMIWLISGHTMLFFIRTIINGRDFWSILLDARFMTIMAGIFPVDSFFTVTGVLTAYLKFNKNNGKAMGKLTYWLEAFVHRYLRFMPMYLIIFWYTRDVSQYIGLGPLWDYATTDTSLRGICKQESVLVPMLFQANFKPLQQHCVKPAWYLANDYQYLLITPIFMALMMFSKWLGYLVLSSSICASLFMQFITVYYAEDFTDFEALINFKPLFATYVLKNLWRLYVMPYNRIAPYLIGLMTGHLMYCAHKTQRKLANNNNIKTNGTTPQLPNKSQVAGSPSSAAVSSLQYHNAAPHILNNNNLNNSDESLGSILSSELSDCNHHHHHQLHQRQHQQLGSTETIIPTNKQIKSLRERQDVIEEKATLFAFLSAISNHICIKVWIPLIFLISIIYLPTLTKLTTQVGEPAKIGASLIIALMRFVWSLAVARLIYICATKSITKTDSFIIRFLSSSHWKPWSKIGLSVLLIQWEIISYFAQTQASLPIMTISFLLAIVLLCIVATYALGLLIYLTIEYPLSQIEHLYINRALFSKR